MFSLHDGINFGSERSSMFKKGDYVNERYEVLTMIGSGGTSSVYLVADRHIGRSLAMKVMSIKSMGAFRFARSEIESLRRVRYPLFPAIVDAFRDERYIYIISEYVKGVSLAKLSREGKMTKHRCLSIAERICEALIYLHEMPQPMLYLDLKPENIIITEDGLPHLVDFGIAGLLAAKHIPVGTAGYSPPEQYDPDIGMDERTDLFALGMTYYSIRCRIPPDADTNTALSDIRHSKLLSSSERSFLTKCCAPDKNDRYMAAREVLKQIKHIRSIPDRLKNKFVKTAVFAGVLLIVSYTAKVMIVDLRQKTSATALVAEATKHMKEGEYTPEGIRIIKACIGSGNLPYECEQEFIFEVAVNSMLIAGDYRTAASYFERLDPERFPEASDYITLCSMQRSFDHDSKEALEVTGRLFGDMVRRAPSKMKYENLIVIAGCFENYESDPLTGARKALSVLMIEKEELDDLIQSGSCEDDSDLPLMKKRVDELIEVRKRRLDIKKRMTGDKT